MKVFVYRNLHANQWSIKAMEGEDKGRVIAHAPSVSLTDVKPSVSESGRQRVLREKKKYVHAGLVGSLNGLIGATFRYGGDLYKRYERNFFVPTATSRTITYNPYKSRFFERTDCELVMRHAEVIRLSGSTVHASFGSYVTPDIALELGL